MADLLYFFYFAVLAASLVGGVVACARLEGRP